MTNKNQKVKSKEKNKKNKVKNSKKIIIAIIIILLLGLIVFTFVVPKENKKSNKPVKEIKEEKKKKVEKEDTNDLELVEQPVVKPVIQPVVNNYNYNIYELAKALVEKASKDLDEESLFKASEVVSKLSGTNKEELEKKLNEIANWIEVKRLVSILENKVNNFEDIDDVNEARNYKENKNIISKVSNLSNEALKEELNNKLSNLSNILDDIKSPTININDNDILNVNPILEVEDNNDVTIILDDVEIENNSEIEDGIHTLVVIDKAFNSTTIKFIVDTQSPSIKVDETVYDIETTETIYSNTDFIAEILEDISGIDKIYLDGGEVTSINITEEGTHTLKLIDKASNEVEFSIVVDKTNPDATITLTELVATLNPTEDVIVTNNEGSLTYTFTEPGEFTFYFVDLAGNEGSKTVTLASLDVTAPSLVGNIQFSNTGNKNKKIISMTFDEEIQKPDNWDLSLDKKTISKEINIKSTSRGSVVVKDLDDNEATINWEYTN